ncbi:MAG: sigma-54-dependent Fis family transcriptional regulator [Methylococcales bacterium]|nr:sigma-54-dependent Fis family transcriptional regulator [Methylococcales bacterium]
MKKPIALIIDDEAGICELLEITLNRMGIETHTAGTVAKAKTSLKKTEFDLCLTDLRLPDGDGLEILDYIQQVQASLPVAMISAHGSMDTAIVAMKKGAFDFISKPINLEGLRKLVSHALELSANPPPLKKNKTEDNLLGQSPVMSALRAKIAKIARSQAPVYINGESGSGKELVAKLIHQQGSRHNNAFIAINCGAIPHELMESEFFGHKKGSFTGAVADKKGLFQAADGGTLFLDEIADLPLSLQVKLLRAIQEKKIRPVGGQQEVTVDVRLLSATHKDLDKMVKEDAFRQDLYYRINVIELNVPALKNRTEDIPELADYFLKLLSVNNGITVPAFANCATKALINYSFPGNVRELENILERALALYEGDTITEDDLNLPLHTDDRQLMQDYDPSETSLETHLETMERDIINEALTENKWNKTATAKYLGLSFRSLRYRLKKLELE